MGSARSASFSEPSRRRTLIVSDIRMGLFASDPKKRRNPDLHRPSHLGLTRKAISSIQGHRSQHQRLIRARMAQESIPLNHLHPAGSAGTVSAAEVIQGEGHLQRSFKKGGSWRHRVGISPGKSDRRGPFGVLKRTRHPPATASCQSPHKTSGAPGHAPRMARGRKCRNCLKSRRGSKLVAVPCGSASYSALAQGTSGTCRAPRT